MAGGAYAFGSRRDHLKTCPMNPNEQSRLIEIMAELLVEVQGMRQEQIGMRHEQRETNQRLDRLEMRTEQNTAAIGELRLSFMKLADKLEAIVDISKRVQRLEDKVFS